MNGIVYYLADPRIPTEVRYIGITCKGHVDLRLIEHIRNARNQNDKSHRATWIRKLLSEDVYPIIKELEEHDHISVENLFKSEIKYISAFRELGYKLVNSTDGGDGVIGYTHSDYTKAIIGDAGKKQWENMSEDNKARIKENLMVWNDCRKEKIRASKIGKSNPQWKHMLLQLDEELNIVKEWESVAEAAKAMGVVRSAITNAAYKRTKDGSPAKCKGYYWKYQTESND